jgi:hypothetical protein
VISCKGFVHTMHCEFAELSASDCKKALCCPRLGEGESGEVNLDLLSYT